jgi:probable F420-dependent oxidoreductase
MKFGLRLPTYVFDEGQTATLADLVAYARKAEALGFDSLWVVEHCLVANPSYRVTFLDPLIVLAAVAPVTERIRLGTSILQLPLRRPLQLAKEIATLDWLSGGRFEFGIGVGWHPGEFSAFGIPLQERGRRTDEYLDVMIRLWTEDHVTFHGSFVDLNDVTLLPKPTQKPYPRLSFGGGSTVAPVYADDLAFRHRSPQLDRVFRRIGRYASAWQAMSTSEPSLLQQDWAEIGRHARENGRNPDEIERMQTTYLVLDEDIERVRRLYGRVVGKDFDAFLSRSSYLFGSARQVVDEIKQREALGIDRMILTPLRVDLDELDQWAEEIVRAVTRQPGPSAGPPMSS